MTTRTREDTSNRDGLALFVLLVVFAILNAHFGWIEGPYASDYPADPPACVSDDPYCEP